MGSMAIWHESAEQTREQEVLRGVAMKVGDVIYVERSGILHEITH